MADEVKALAPKLRSVAGDLDDAAGHVQDILTTLRAARAKHWGKWGSDDFGKNFAGGEGYEKSDANLISAVESKIALLKSYSTGLHDAAKELDRMEDANRTDFET
ncbi:hypothetical protein [Nocardia australiensis]|uniref:hypothetical protein n=1 Tax=Nocardia australiensis TaxID=2887191 RepID=UPI001D142A9D|nr:hypothetical protein [Nocardia australiensis]